MTEEILGDRVYASIDIPRFFFLLMLAFLIRTAGDPMKNDSKFISVNYIPHLEYFQKQSHEYAFLAWSCRFAASAPQLQTLSRPPICAVPCARIWGGTHQNQYH